MREKEKKSEREQQIAREIWVVRKSRLREKETEKERQRQTDRERERLGVWERENHFTVPRT